MLNMPGPQQWVAEFMDKFGRSRAERPSQLSEVENLLSCELIREEFIDELLPASGMILVDADGDTNRPVNVVSPFNAQDLVEIADALGDIIYVCYLKALKHGIDLDEVIAEIHRANMSKLGPDGKAILREDGKIIKGPNYSPPNIGRILEQQARG